MNIKATLDPCGRLLTLQRLLPPFVIAACVPGDILEVYPDLPVRTRDLCSSRRQQAALQRVAHKYLCAPKDSVRITLQRMDTHNDSSLHKQEPLKGCSTMLAPFRLQALCTPKRF